MRIGAGFTRRQQCVTLVFPSEEAVPKAPQLVQMGYQTSKGTRPLVLLRRGLQVEWWLPGVFYGRLTANAGRYGASQIAISKQLSFCNRLCMRCSPTQETVKCARVYIGLLLKRSLCSFLQTQAGGDQTIYASQQGKHKLDWAVATCLILFQDVHSQ